MSERIDQFCHDLNEKLTAVESRLDVVKGSVESAKNEAEDAVRSKRDEAKSFLEEAKAKADAAKQKQNAVVAEKVEEVKQWIADREVDRLQARAERRANEAAWAIDLAMSAVAAADLAVLEAVTAQMEADEASSG